MLSSARASDCVEYDNILDEQGDACDASLRKTSPYPLLGKEKVKFPLL